MKIVDCLQGTDEWVIAKLGVPSASNFNKIITSTGNLSKQAPKYMQLLLNEITNGYLTVEYESAWMKRGKELEEEARDYYSNLTKQQVCEVGFIYNDSRQFGCSPDGILKDKGLEIKCPKELEDISKYYTQYKAQIQGSMLITGFKKWDLFIYHVGYNGKNTEINYKLKTYDRDEKFIEKLSEYLTAFSEVFNKEKEKVMFV